MEINHLDYLITMESNNTKNSSPISGTPFVPAVQHAPIRLSQSEIQSWLRGLNLRLGKAGRPTMSEAQVDSFSELLVQCGYNSAQAKCAQVFILCGKWTNYRLSDLQFEYFFPKEDDMRPFADQFVHCTINEAQIKEIQRQFEVEKQRMTEAAGKKDRMYAEATQEIRRLKGEPRSPVPVTDLDEEIKKLSRLYLSEQSKRLEVERKLRILQTENNLLARKYNRSLATQAGKIPITVK